MIVRDERSGHWIDDKTGEIVEVIEARNGNFENNTEKPVLAIVEVPAKGKVKAGKKGNRLKKTKEPFTMVFLMPDIQVQLLEGQMTEQERAFMFTFLHFIEYGKRQIMVPDDTGQLQRLTMTRAGEVMGWKHRRTVKRVVDSLVQKGLLMVVPNGNNKFIDINPRYYFRGDMNIRSEQIKYFDSTTTKREQS